MKQFGLPKRTLLRKSREFMQVYRQGRRLKGPGFTLIFVANGRNVSRLGVSVHRLIRGAVRRNRIKRMIREVFRMHREMFPQSCDIVITVAPEFSCSTTLSVLQALVLLFPSGKAVSA